MSEKYYRIMVTPKQSWKPYRLEPMYDEAPDLGSYESTLFLSTPAEGDYIVCSADKTTHIESSSFDCDFNDVSFNARPSLSELQSNHEIIEVPESIAKLDLHMQDEISNLHFQLREVEENIDKIDNYLSDLNSAPHLAPEEIKSQRSVYLEQFAKLSTSLDVLQAEYQEKVLAVLPVEETSKHLQECGQSEKIQMWYENAVSGMEEDAEMEM